MKDFTPQTLSLDGQTILVTGGTGSFGKHFIKTVLERYQPKKLIVYSRDELKQFEMQQDPFLAQHDCMRYFIGDVRDVERLKLAFRDVDIVIHAAALKQVPAAEYNPMECIKTNVNGAENIVRASIYAGVQKVIALSTDKAANPINLYGASKLASDKIFVAANNLSGEKGTSFSVVRYGNVVGSRGSIIPFFQRLIEQNRDHLPITDTRMTRFWITLQQGVDFVLSSLEMMQRGEIFVPKIPSMRVTDMATWMAPDLPHKVIGIRPGEKLHETMVPMDESLNTLELNDRYVIHPHFLYWKECQTYYNNAKPVPIDFSYTSDQNSEWIDAHQFKTLMTHV